MIDLILSGFGRAAFYGLKRKRGFVGRKVWTANKKDSLKLFFKVINRQEMLKVLSLICLKKPVKTFC